MGTWWISFIISCDDEELSTLWRQNYIKTFLERDIPNLGFTVYAVT